MNPIVNFAKRNLLPREQQLAIAALGVMVSWVVVSWIGLPLWNHLNQLDQQRLLAEKKLTRLKELASRKPIIEQAYQRYARFRSAEPDERIQQAFLNELEQLGQGGEFSMNLKPRPAQRQGDVTRFGVELDVEATQQDLLAFLDRLLASASLLELERLRISTTASKDHPLKATLLVNKVIVRSN